MGWADLLRRLYRDCREDLSEDDRRDCRAILSEGSPPGSRLIEAASILRRAAGRNFDQQVRRANTPAAGTFTETHESVLSLRPRGIVTFNYDDAHESAARKGGNSLRVLLPTLEAGLRTALREKLQHPFLLKAHGSIRSKEPLVLTYESYRNLLVRQPAYRAFLQTILVDFHLLIVGFGLADPDFDLFLSTTASVFGSPLQEHIVINKIGGSSSREVELRRRYGIRTLYVNTYADIPHVLNAGATTPGPRLREVLRRATTGSFTVRGAAHQELRALGPAGKACAEADLRKRLTSERNAHVLSEVVYSLGIIDPEANKQQLIAIVESSPHSAPVGRALTVLRSVLVRADLPRVRRWRRKFEHQPLREDPGNRLAVYCHYLEVYIPSKATSDATRPRHRKR